MSRNFSSHPRMQQAAVFARRFRVPLGILVFLFVVLPLIYVALAYLWLPGFARGELETALAEKLRRPVKVAQVAFQPFTLELTLTGLQIGEREGEGKLLALESAYVNLSSRSILRRAPVISGITLKQPVLHVSRGKDGRLSIADIIEEFANQPPSPQPTLFSVSNILLEGGRIEFDDRQKGSHQVVSEIKLGLPFIANFEADEETWVQPHLVARLNNGSVLALEGKARPFTDKREAVVDLKLDGFDLTSVDEYAPTPDGLRLSAGKLDSQLEVHFIQDRKNKPEISLTGGIVLRELAVSNRAKLPWDLQGERIAVQVKDFDPTLARPVNATVDGKNVRVRQGERMTLVLDKLTVTQLAADTTAKTASFDIDATVNGDGALKAKGSVAWAPLAADVDVDMEGVDVAALQGIAADKLNATLSKGDAGFKGKIKVATVGADTKVAVDGDARIANFSLQGADGDDLLRWRSLDIATLHLTTAPFAADIAKVSLADFYARVAISPEGKLNLKDIVRGSDVAAVPAVPQSPTVDAAKVVAPADVPKTDVVIEDPANPNKTTVKSAKGGSVTVAAVPEKTKTLPVRIGQILLQGGNVNFSDRFIKPNYRANLTSLAGKIGPLDPGKPGNVEVRGSIDKAAPLDISGKVDPFAKDMYVDITAKAKGIDLPAFSPYSGKYIGYAIRKGKLSVDVHYKVENGVLAAENNIFLDQLTLGDKIESSSAMSLPITLAIALLKNSRGEIDLHIPVSGSLNDPEFSLGGVIGTVIKNLLVKIVTSPFKLIGSIFGGSDDVDLSQVAFQPGRARIDPEVEKGLETLSKALADRPALKLDIIGVADPANDREALKRAVLDRRVKTQKQADLEKNGEAPPLADIEISPAEYPKYLERAYKAEKFEKPKNIIGLSKSLPVPEMEQLMLANIPSGDDELRSLAERRARVVREWLITKGVASERVFVLSPRVDAEGDGRKLAGRVELELR